MAMDLVIVAGATLLYTYLVFPLLIRLLAAVFPREAPQSSEDYRPKVSAIVCCAGEWDWLEPRLTDLMAQDYPELEVLLVLDGVSLPEGLEVALRQKVHQLVVLSQEGPAGKTAAQNLAATRAGGEVLLFTDPATSFGPGAIARLVAPLADRAVVATCGELSFSGHAPEALYWRFECGLKRAESRFCGLLGANGALYAMRKADYVPLAPWVISDLVEPLLALFLRGGRVHYVPEACAFEPVRPGVRRTFAAKRRISLRAFSSLPLLMPALDLFARPRLAFVFISHKLLRWWTWWFALELVLGLWLLGPVGRSLLAAAGGLAAWGTVSPGFIVSDILAYMLQVLTAQALAVLDAARGMKLPTWSPTHGADR